MTAVARRSLRILLSSARERGHALDLARIIDLRVARRIREQRLRVGMTQQKLADIIGVAFQQAHKYEHGFSRVSAGRLFHIATALEAPITYFFALDEGAAPPVTDADQPVAGNDHGQ